MKRNMILAILLVWALALTGCGSRSDHAKPQGVELTVFAAASLQETLTELGEKYMADHENVTIIFTFDSSGTLKSQIENGAYCDVFLSAGQKQMDGLSELLLEDTRFNILENKVALAVPEGNAASINSYADLVAGLEQGTVLLAMGNSDVPVGQYTQKILAYFHLSEEELAAKGCISYSSNVKEVTTQVSEGAVDCGIIYQTDAYSAGLTVVDTATAEMCGQVIYPAAVLNISENADEAQAFLEFLTNEEADGVFEAVGFTPLG